VEVIRRLPNALKDNLVDGWLDRLAKGVDAWRIGKWLEPIP
jgi:hypothetical protein